MRRLFSKGALWALALMGSVGLFSAPSVWGQSSEITPVSGKAQAYMGDPGRKRGLELGFDQGYLAAKADQAEGLDPDLSRHDLYHDPRPFYRYEFGNRGMFYHGFRSGFIVGYKYVVGENVKYVSPRMDSGSVLWGAAGMEMEGAPGRNASPGTKKKAVSKPAVQSRVISDAL